MNPSYALQLIRLLPTGKYTEDRWLKKTGGRSVVGDALGAVGIGNGGDLLNARGGGGSMINVNGKCGLDKMKTHNTGPKSNAYMWLRECCGQVEAKQV